ncbi:MAG: cyanophycin synthetase, partial [Gammaproteobacteria bacterium]
SCFQSAADRNLVLREVLAEPGGMTVRFDGDWGKLEIPSRLVGRFNADNLALALAVLLVMDVAAEQACSALSQVSAPPGRMEIFRSAEFTGPSLVVDYAHTPDALEKALRALRLHCRGRLTVIFGCGGDRDRGKRPEMGRVAEELADVVILTYDNPRSEDGGRIVEDILAGMKTRPAVIRDREAAIRSAYDQSGEGDVVLVAGKGHEDYQIVGAERRRYSDRDVADSLTGGAA